MSGRARRILNQARRGARVLEEVRSLNVGSMLGDDELVEIEPGVWGRPQSSGSPLEQALAGVDRLLDGVDRIRNVARGLHVYGAAARKGRR